MSLEPLIISSATYDEVKEKILCAKAAKPSTTSQKRQDIQGIRGWAIAMVVAFHFFPDYCPNGYVGVDMFFVISGFLMAMVITRNTCICRVSLLNFYYRRLKRILPLYYVVSLAILLLVILKLPTYRSLNLPRSRRAISFTANIRISKKDPLKEYEEMLTNAVDLFTHTWSLCVEMQWYLLVPLLFYVQSLFPFRKITFFSGVAFASMGFYLYADNNTAFYSVLARMWQFCAGIIAFLWHHNNAGALTEAEKTVDCDGLQKGVLTYSRFTQFFSWIVFILDVLPPFFGIILPKEFLRVETTIMTAIVIVAEKRYQVPVLTRPDIVYVGEISYALYLIHWPVFVVMKYFYPENPLSSFVGVFLSVFLAVLVHQYYETVYLGWSPRTIILLIFILLGGCIVLSSMPSEPEIIKAATIDYNKININDAAWNMTLMRLLNAAEDPRGTHLWNKECSYSERFLNRKLAPLGFCTMTRGDGKFDMLVAGNSYASNQGGLIYKAFKPYARQFNIFSMSTCEMFPPNCSRIPFNFTRIIEELNPAVVFMVDRSFSLKVSLNVTEPIENDKVFGYYLKTLKFIERSARKIYIVQAIPSCVNSCSRVALQYLKKGRALRTIKDALVRRDEFFARHRIRELCKRCRKCEIVDYMPVLIDKKGQYYAYDPETNLMYLDYENHFNRFGKQRLQIVFDRLAEDFAMFINK